MTPHRGNAKQHESRVVAQLLTLMDGMNSVKSLPLVIIAATNRPNAIDPALRRPGRFEREVGVDIPSPEARSKILRYLTRKMTMSQDVDLDRIALSAIGYVGADLVNLCREMAMHSMSRNSTSFE